MKNLYVCVTYYHVLVSIIKAYKSECSCDILLCEKLAQNEDFIKNLKESKIFDKVYLLEKQLVLKGLKEKLQVKRIIKERVEKELDIDFSKYNDRIIFNEMSDMSAYFQAKNLSYILSEDGTNYYKDVDIDKKLMSFKLKLFNFLGLGFKYFGSYKNIKWIEVNDKSIIKISHNKVREVNKRELFSSIEEELLNKLLKIFDVADIKNIDSKKSVLLLTQPLYEQNIINDKNTVLEIYKEIIEQYGKGMDVYIKQHPLEDMDFLKLIKGVKVINKNFPSELLNYINGFRVKKAITIFSTAIYSLKCADEQICLGYDWLTKRIKGE